MVQSGNFLGMSVQRNRDRRRAGLLGIDGSARATSDGPTVRALFFVALFFSVVLLGL